MIQQDYQRAVDVFNAMFDIDFEANQRSRKAPYAMARRIIGVWLTGCGYTVTATGNQLGRNHSIICNFRTAHHAIMRADDRYGINYQIAYADFMRTMQGGFPCFSRTPREYKKQMYAG